MKNLFKVCSLSLFLAGMGMFMTSCGGDTCYDCSGEGLESEEICEGGDEDLTSEQVDALILIYEGLGGTCTKK